MIVFSEFYILFEFQERDYQATSYPGCPASQRVSAVPATVR